MRKLVLKQGGDDLFAFAVGKIFFRPKRRNPKEKKKVNKSPLIYVYQRNKRSKRKGHIVNSSGKS